MKSVSMSVNIIIIIAVAVLVIASMAAFFLSSSFGGITEAEAQRVFAGGCARYCQPDLYETFRNAYTASQNDHDFVSACERLGYGDGAHVNRCFERCSNCFLEVNQDDINRGYDNLIALTERG